MLHIRTPIAISDDASFIRDNLCFLECEISHIRYATEREQDMRVGYFLLFLISFDCRSEDEISSFSVSYTRMIANIDSGSLKGRANGMREVIVLS